MGLFGNQALMTVMGDGMTSGMFLYRDGIAHVGEETGRKTERRKWDEITGIYLEDGDQLEKRVTVTRLMTLGVFAMALPKKTGGTKYITVEGDDFFWSTEVSRKKVRDAQQFVMRAKSMKAKAR